MEEKINEIKKFYFKKELIYEFIKDIKDPEKDCSIEELDLIHEDWINISVNSDRSSYTTIEVEWKPTTKNCSLAVNIGLSIRYKLEKEINLLKVNLKNSKFKYDKTSFKYKLEIRLQKGSHNTEHEINKQLNDRERYCAALENPQLLKYIQNLTDDICYD